ncbi:MAG: hypothetical protein AAGC81_03500 [Pseudomonadota bacterium]
MILEQKIWAPLSCAAAATIAAAVYGEMVRLPFFFPGSDALILGGFTTLLSLSIGLMLPERVIFTPQERLIAMVVSRGAGSAENAARVIERVERAQSYADRLRRSDNGFHTDLRAAVDEVAADMDEIANRMIERPADTSDMTAILARAGLAVEAVERHAEIREESASNADAVLQEARDKVIGTLRHLADVMDATMQRRVTQKLTGLEVTTDVADGLYQSMKGTDT